MVNIKSKREIEFIRESCRITALALKEIEKNINPGLTTYQLDKIAEEVITGLGAIPSFKNYPSGFEQTPNFPATACISINDEVIHGIPSKRRYIKEGDIVSVDLGAYKNGFHGDAARTYIIGQVPSKIKELVEVTKNSFFEGIKYAKVGNRVGDISNAIGEYITKHGLYIVTEFQGHGVGRALHEEPGIPNYGKPKRGIRLEEGMTLAIEPMVNIGTSDIFVLDDGWTVLTEDGSFSSHYEDTILITKKEPEVLTLV